MVFGLGKIRLGSQIRAVGENGNRNQDRWMGRELRKAAGRAAAAAHVRFFNGFLGSSTTLSVSTKVRKGVAT
ncbi:hypothetical protein Peur_001206 [Populus x canadensis]